MEIDFSNYSYEELNKFRREINSVMLKKEKAAKELFKPGMLIVEESANSFKGWFVTDIRREYVGECVEDDMFVDTIVFFKRKEDDGFRFLYEESADLEDAYHTFNLYSPNVTYSYLNLDAVEDFEEYLDNAKQVYFDQYIRPALEAE